jgi:hypothetical protein
MRGSIVAHMRHCRRHVKHHNADTIYCGFRDFVRNDYWLHEAMREREVKGNDANSFKAEQVGKLFPVVRLQPRQAINLFH